MKMDLLTLLAHIFEQRLLLTATLSGPRQGDAQKMTIRPLIIQGTLYYQWTTFRQQQAFHHNFSAVECLQELQKTIGLFKQTLIHTEENDYQILINKKQQATILRKAPASKAQTKPSLQHNRTKNYLLEEGHPLPFLVELGIMNQAGQVYAQKQDKFRQINRFLEMVEDVLPHLKSKAALRLIDFGCGKAYLTFALYHYLKHTKGLKVEMLGLDLKADVIQYCQDLAKRLGEHDLHFQVGDINQYTTDKPVDVVVSLHACDTATDAALEKAIRWQAEVILAVPCCQHELFKQIQQKTLEPLLKHGILRERFAALVTDAARAQILEVLGYQTQILEFIDVEHTPKNLLIRAIKQAKKAYNHEAWQAYLDYKQALKIDPSLERRLLPLDLLPTA